MTRASRRSDSTQDRGPAQIHPTDPKPRPKAPTPSKSSSDQSCWATIGSLGVVRVSKDARVSVYRSRGYSRLPLLVAEGSVRCATLSRFRLESSMGGPSGVLSRLQALWLDDSDSIWGYFSEAMAIADIDATTVRDSEAALQRIRQICMARGILDVFITDFVHPGIWGAELIARIRSLPDEMTVQGGLRVRHIPIVVFTGQGSEFVDEQIRAVDSSVPIVSKPAKPEDLLRAIDSVIRDYRERILAELHNVGIAIRIEGGRCSLMRCFSLGEKQPIETKYLSADAADGVASATHGFRRLVLVCDRNWSASRAVLELEYLLNERHAGEKELQRFFRLHPEFLLQNGSLEHWAEPVLRDRSSGTTIRPDFILKSMFLPERPWSWQIVDLKGPDVPLVVRRSFHATLSQHVHRVVSQLRNYSDYFSKPCNQDEIAAKFGTTLQHPKLVAVIGRLPRGESLQPYTDLRGRVMDVALITYDEILEFRRSQVEWRNQSLLTT